MRRERIRKLVAAFVQSYGRQPYRTRRDGRGYWTSELRALKRRSHPHPASVAFDEKAEAARQAKRRARHRGGLR
jgi:hypothetical protein